MRSLLPAGPLVLVLLAATPVLADPPEEDPGGDEEEPGDEPPDDGEGTGTDPEEEPGLVIEVVDFRRAEATPATHYEEELGELQSVPRTSAAEQLMLAPGVLATNHGGEGHAQAFYMRGFDAGEGQDIEFTVDGVPLNEVSNPHGHGYTDLNFIPPELVCEIAITEGSFDPAQGDFAFAGSADYRLGVPERGTRVMAGYGRWNSLRTLVTVAPPSADEQSFGAFEAYSTEGYGDNRAAQRATALGRVAWGGDGGPRQALSVYGYAVRYDQAGVVRADDVADGTIDELGTYDPNQGGESGRLLLAHRIALPGEGAYELTSFLGLRTLRMRANWTGWMNDPGESTDGVLDDTQRGDGQEMRYRVLTAGARGRYEISGRFRGLPQTLTLGHAARLDSGQSEQYRLRAVTAVPYDTVYDARFDVLNLAGWGRAQLAFTDWLRLRGGVRLDTFSFGVTDQELDTSDRDGTRLDHQSAQAFGFAFQPRGTVDLILAKGLHLLGSYGHGARSTEAMALSDNETAPFATAKEADLGLAWRRGLEGDPLFVEAQASASLVRIDQDLLFDETAGRNVVEGPSTRRVALLHARARADGWLDAVLNVGFTHATLDETGELLPYLPRWITRGDLAAVGSPWGWSLAGEPVQARLGLGLTWVPSRPLPYGEWGDPMTLLDLGAELRRWPVALGVEVRNLLDQRYHESEYVYASNFDGPEATASRVPELHYAAGEPFTVMGTLTLWFERPQPPDADPED